MLTTLAEPNNCVTIAIVVMPLCCDCPEEIIKIYGIKYVLLTKLRGAMDNIYHNTVSK